MSINRKYGWRPSRPSPEPWYLHHNLLCSGEPLPKSVDLRPTDSPIYDQGELGSCTATAICGAVRFGAKKINLPMKDPSRRFLYYNERVIEGDTGSDAGAMILDGLTTAHELGICPEDDWGYDPTQVLSKPSDLAYRDAPAIRVESFTSINPQLQQLMQCLANGFPFVFGFTLFESFESDKVAQTGIMPMPDVDTESRVGGHAVMCLGYDQGDKTFLVRNSWGTKWGMDGYFKMPFAYMNPTLATDFWTLVPWCLRPLPKAA